MSTKPLEVVEYSTDSQWVGSLDCPQCLRATLAWRSSGMSECFPHFYCNACSNVYRRIKDQDEVYNTEPTQEILDRIAAALPACDCGGRFTPGANPKCSGCGFEFAHQNDPVARLTDPHMILVDGAAVYNELGAQYRVKIVEAQAGQP